MKEQNQNSRRLREQLDQHKFELPASSWEHMADILDGKQPVPQPQSGQESQRRKGFWWMLFAGLLTIFGFAGAQYAQWWNTADAITAAVTALPIPMPQQQSVPIGNQIQTAGKATKVTATKMVTGKSARSTPPPSVPLRQSTPLSDTPKKGASVPTYDRQQEPATLQKTATTPVAKLVRKPFSVTASPATIRLRKTTLVAPLPTLPAALLAERESSLSAEAADPVKLSAFQFGLKTGLDAQPLQTTALVGLFARYRLSGKWALQLEPQYKLRSDGIGRGLELEASSVQNTYYPTRAESSSRELQITRLHFFELPLTALYQVHPKLQLLAGAQLVYVSNVSRKRNVNRRSNSTEDFQSPMDSATVSSTRINDSPGVVDWDAGLILGADYQLTPKFSIDLRYVQGLYDLTYDAFFLNEDDYLNSSLQLSVKWRW